MSELEEITKAIEKATLTTMKSPEEVGKDIKKFANWFLSLTDEDRFNIIVDTFKNPPSEELAIGIQEFKNRHPDWWISQNT